MQTGSDITRLLITGASGFIGRQAVDAALARGFEVHALARRAGARRHPSLTWHEVDLLDSGDRAHSLLGDIRASHLLHLAWCATPGTFWTSSENYQWVSATIGLASAFVNAGGVRLVGAGTGAEYVETDDHCREDGTSTGPISPYAVAKDATRRLLASLTAEAGVSFAWARLFHLYGPGEHPKRLVASVSNSLLRGERALCSRGLSERDYLHVRDAGDALVALTASSIHGSVNVASGEAIAVRDLVASVAARLGRPDLVDFGALPDRPEARRQVADVSRLHAEVGWSPMFDLESGVLDAVEWHRQQLRATGATSPGAISQ